MSQRVMITAGASGIGLAIAKAFSGNGAQVHVCDLDEHALAALKKENPTIVGAHVNVTDEIAVGNWFDTALGQLSGIDVLVNNAGIKGPTGYAEDISITDWRDCLSVCLDSHFICTKRVIPVMKQQRSGSIINISSTAGLYGYGLRSPYAAAKWAVIGFTKSIAIELGPFEVRANAICPGTVDGARMQRVIRAEAEGRGVSVQVVENEYIQSQSIKRFVKGEEIADMCRFLASPDAKMVTGQAISVDGHTETFHIGN